MKVKDIEIEEAPFSDEQLDECLRKIDFIIDLHFAPDTNQLDAIIKTINVVEEGGAGKVIYIHNYPKTLQAYVGVKYNREFFKEVEGNNANESCNVS